MTAQAALPGELVRAAFGAISSPKDIMSMATSVSSAVAEKRIQVWVRDPAALRVLDEMNWDAGLLHGPGDYLYLVDNKRLPNKVDYFTSSSLDYTVTLHPDGGATARERIRRSKRRGHSGRACSRTGGR